jgi:hypothetical protein
MAMSFLDTMIAGIGLVGLLAIVDLSFAFEDYGNTLSRAEQRDPEWLVFVIDNDFHP